MDCFLLEFRSRLTDLANPLQTPLVGGERGRRKRTRHGPSESSAAPAAARSDAFLAFTPPRPLRSRSAISKGLRHIGRRPTQLRGPSGAAAATAPTAREPFAALDRSRYLIVVLSPEARRRRPKDQRPGRPLAAHDAASRPCCLVLAGGRLQWDAEHACFDPERLGRRSPGTDRTRAACLPNRSTSTSAKTHPGTPTPQSCGTRSPHSRPRSTASPRTNWPATTCASRNCSADSAPLRLSRWRCCRLPPSSRRRWRTSSVKPLSPNVIKP